MDVLLSGRLGGHIDPSLHKDLLSSARRSPGPELLRGGLDPIAWSNFNNNTAN